MHFSFAPRWVDPQDPPGNPGGMVQFGYFLFTRRGGELFSFGLRRPTGCSRVLVSGISLYTKAFFQPLT